MAASYSSERLADRKPIVLIAGLCWNNGGLPPHRQRQRLPGAVISGPVSSGFRRQRSLFKAVPFAFFALAALLCGMVSADEAALEWNGVPRIVAIGDLHGDYEQYLKVLTDAGLISKRGKWTGGDTHLVQTGDVTDRGPDSIAIIEHLEALKKQARRKDGRVHTLIGNHEAMNSYGDLRYVHPGEYAHFTNRRSASLREMQWDYTLAQLEQTQAETLATLDLEQYRKEWEQQYPLGWVEHRNAWMPDGEYGQWLLENPVAVMVNGSIFLHGGISASYCHMSLREMTDQAHQELRHFNPQAPGMIEDPMGPLWYRGLAEDDEQMLIPVVEAILERYEAERIVVGHTPTGGVVWPRFQGRVVANDTGIAAHYGGHEGFLEIVGDTAVAGYGDQRLELPRDDAGREDYLKAVMALQPGNELLAERLQWLQSSAAGPSDSEAGAPPAEDEAGSAQAQGAKAEASDAGAVGVSPDICR